MISFNFQISTVKYWWTRYQSDGNVLTKQRSGRNQILKSTQKTEILTRISDDPFLTATYFGRQYNVSYTTITRFLAKNGIHCRVAANQTRLTDEHKINRMAFCETILESWDQDKLNSVIFSDEKTFSTDVRWKKHVYRPRNTRYNGQYIKTLNLSGRINAAYWGAISINGPCTKLVKVNGKFNSEQYLKILKKHLVPAMKSNAGMIYMQDNSPVHTANVVMEYLSKRPFETMSWCPLSPDLNPIENVWSYITYDWPDMIQRTDAALNELVQTKWSELKEKKGKFNFNWHNTTIL